jgi:DMSO/TMAO reductase YedYZ molybdopterin-dependent catalytic subunit
MNDLSVRRYCSVIDWELILKILEERQLMLNGLPEFSLKLSVKDLKKLKQEIEE